MGWRGFSGYRTYSKELSNDLRELEQFLAQINSRLGRLVPNEPISTASGPSTAAATISEPYVTIGASTNLLAERRLTAGSGISITDGGPNNPVTVASTVVVPAGADPTASVGLSTVNGSDATFMRSDAAPPLDQSISPTWTGAHTFDHPSGVSPLFNDGIDLSTDGNIYSNVADGAGKSSFTFFPIVAQTSGTDRYYFRFNTTAGAFSAGQYADSTWEFKDEVKFTGGIDLGTSGRFDSNVANTGTNIGFLFKPTTAFSGATTIAQFQDSAGNVGLVYKADGTWEFGGTTTAGGYINLGVSLSHSQGINFLPASMSGAGATTPLANTLLGAQFGCTPTATPAGAYYVGGNFFGRPTASMTANFTGFWGGWFQGQMGNTGNGSRTFTEAGGWKVFGCRSTAKNIGVLTNWYGGYVENSNTGAFSATGAGLTNGYGLYLEEQTRAATINNGIFLANATAGRKLICMRDQNAWIGSDAAARIDIGSTDFLVQSTNIGFFNVTPAARPAAYTQTYATASRTHSNLTAATLTDSTGGTANTTLVAISGTGDDANVNNNFADLAAQVNALLTDITNVKQVLNSVIDDDQTLGLKQ